MTGELILKPSPNHPITIAPTKGRVIIKVLGRVIADTRNALTLKEASYPAAQYIPISDVEQSLIERTDYSTYCPYKGRASYYNIPTDVSRSKNGIWTYETPYEAVAQINDHVAFYPNAVDSIEITTN